jgi:hypothetical protein
MVRFINRAICTMALCVLPALLLGQDKTTAPQGPTQSFPAPDFVLRDKGGGGTVLGPFEDDGKGRGNGGEGNGVSYYLENTIRNRGRPRNGS